MSQATLHEANDDERMPAPLHAIDINDQQVRAENAVAELLSALGRDVTSAHLVETPRRVAASLLEMLTPRDFTMTTFPNDEGYEELVIVRDIPFHSLCEHHLLPFRGVAHIGYVPGDRIVGLSKLARVVELFSRDLQVQERLTQQISAYLTEQLAPRGVGVVLEAEHLCMTMRGAQAAGAMTTTTSFTGVLSKDNPMRRQFRLAGDLTA
ncbi:GTP cyclohydrolase I [Cryobacterium mesophilum]|nr:GTP cyclohydrolase I FolE [Terrimesophilobacter mesophilus]MBB5632738.1 GTP cyclohydrolase I [Terrimesophilobacter mesophilus]